MEITLLLEFTHRDQLRQWFEQYAATDKECWIAMYRSKRSHWTELNKQRCADLEARGLMTDAGRRALEMAVPNGRER